MGLWKALEQQNVVMTKRHPISEKQDPIRSMRLSRSSSCVGMTVSVGAASRMVVAGLGIDIVGGAAVKNGFGIVVPVDILTIGELLRTLNPEKGSE
jgi:hypothetical protein